MCHCNRRPLRLLSLSVLCSDFCGVVENETKTVITDQWQVGTWQPRRERKGRFKFY